ncbi:hypothetical protein [Negadavirga shengliensis]|uniref:Beta-galactosidase trimerisation domain-containing protein n=1 Tax=Negadavirga shengliensis TaxID=1389218 RepID=A0ABV9SWK4_9BACT
MKSIFFFIIGILGIMGHSYSQSPLTSTIDPGKYDGTWWNRAPVRLVQTNLREIDADMDTDAYVQSMVDASASVVLLNVGGIVANYPTELPFQYRNTFMEGDLVGELVEKLHAQGIKVIGRFDFSKINESLAAQKPGWLYVGTAGNTVNFNGQVHTCVNGGYQQDYSLEILTEAITRYPLDGIFFNMIGYQTRDYGGEEHGICQCDNCKRRFKEITGEELPRSANPGDPLHQEYNAFKKETSEALFTKISHHIRNLDPGLMIKTYTDVGVDMISHESGSSLSSAYEWNYHATDNVKRVLGSYNNRSPMNLLIYFQAIGFRHVGTSPHLAKVWMLENMLHGAPLGFVVIGTLVNYEDRIFIPTLNELYGFHRENENLFTNLQPVNKVALVRGAGDEYRGIIKLLTEEHIMYDIIEPAVIGNDRMPRELDDYEVVILADVRNMDDELIAYIDNYVERGGKILATGFTSTQDGFGTPLDRIRLQSLGVKPAYEVFPQTKSTYLRVTADDKSFLGEEEFKDFSIMMMYSDFLKCETAENGRGFMRLIPETMFGPPEKSYFTEAEVTATHGLFSQVSGQGKTAFIPWKIGSQYYFKGNYSHKALFVNTLQNLLELEKTLQTDASPMIEMTHLANRNGAFEWIGMINHSGQIGATLGGPVPIYNTHIRFKPQKSVKEIRLLRSGKSIDFKQVDGWVECRVPELNDFEMVLCLY